MNRSEEVGDPAAGLLVAFFRSPVGIKIFHRIVFFCLNCATVGDRFLTLEQGRMVSQQRRRSSSTGSV